MPTVASKALFQKHILKVLGKNVSLSSSHIQKSNMWGGCFSEYSSTIIKIKESITCRTLRWDSEECTVPKNVSSNFCVRELVLGDSLLLSKGYLTASKSDI